MSALVYPAKTVDPVHRAESRAIGPRDVRGSRVINFDDFTAQTGRHLTVGVTHLDQLHLSSGRVFLPQALEDFRANGYGNIGAASFSFGERIYGSI